MQLHLIETAHLPIYEQLVLEEALLRADTNNYCLINQGSCPAIVMGISGKSEELIDLERCTLPILRRYSGGGTVVVDEQTIFVSFIFNKTVHPIPAYPEPILQWSGHLYNSVFPQMVLKENDYVIGHKKCGGNAQYIQKDRWVHHTTFLWDIDPTKMSQLLLPKKTPLYRESRSHLDFLTPLKEHFESPHQWISTLKEELGRRYQVRSMALEEANAIKTRPFRQSTIFS